MEMCPFPASCKIAFAVSCLSLEDSNVTPNYWTAISRALPSPSAECNGIVGAMFQKAVALQVVHRKVLGKLITVCGDSTYQAQVAIQVRLLGQESVQIHGIIFQ